MEQLDYSHSPLMRMQKTATLQNTYDPEIPLLGFYSREMKLMFTQKPI